MATQTASHRVSACVQQLTCVSRVIPLFVWFSCPVHLLAFSSKNCHTGCIATRKIQVVSAVGLYPLKCGLFFLIHESSDFHRFSYAIKKKQKKNMQNNMEVGSCARCPSGGREGNVGSRSECVGMMKVSLEENISQRTVELCVASLRKERSRFPWTVNNIRKDDPSADTRPPITYVWRMVFLRERLGLQSAVRRGFTGSSMEDIGAVWMCGSPWNNAGHKVFQGWVCDCLGSMGCTREEWEVCRDPSVQF